MNKSTLGQYGKKLLTIARIIYLETDRDNPLKVKELRECAEQFGVTLPKSSVYIITPEEYDMVFGGDKDA